jgi:hypothetical protein
VSKSTPHGCKNLQAQISGKQRKFFPHIKGPFQKRNVLVRILQGSLARGDFAPNRAVNARQWRASLTSGQYPDS